MKTLDQIRLALENQEFHLVYMPTIDLMNNNCVGAEALIRWDHNGEYIFPNEFISIVENTPISGLLTYWVIEQVADDLGDWLYETEDVHIGINIPPELLGKGGLEYAANKSGLVKVVDKLIFEITERGFPDESGLEALSSNKGRVKVAIDDFGAGDANLMQLSQLEADFIKLDKYFIDQIMIEEEIPKIIKGLVGFAKGMGLGIIAEGVETQIQANVLKKLGVDMAQGWLFSKPLNVDSLIEFHSNSVK